MLDIRPDSTANKFRKERVKLLVSMIDDVLLKKSDCRIIDIGGTLGFWDTWREFFDFSKVSVTCVNLMPSHADYGVENPAVSVRQGDARDLSFVMDREFDIAFSNSVIEHVGLWRDMHKMASEVRRVGKMYLVQTPYFWFPIEPHARTPFIHWLPDSMKYRVVMSRKCGYWGKQKSVSAAVEAVQSALMLDLRQMESLFPDAIVRRERFLGLTKSLIAERRG